MPMDCHKMQDGGRLLSRLLVCRWYRCGASEGISEYAKATVIAIAQRECRIGGRDIAKKI